MEGEEPYIFWGPNVEEKNLGQMKSNFFEFMGMCFIIMSMPTLLQ
jgi:hypothetical protein